MTWFPKHLEFSLCGAEYHSRGHNLCSHSVVSQHFMEPEGSLPSSQELSNCTYPEPDQSNPHHSIPPLKSPSQCNLSTDVLVFLVVSFPLAFLPITYTRSSSPHSCHMPCPPHPQLDNSNYAWRQAQIMQLFFLP
jgi:hypothetical protein